MTGKNNYISYKFNKSKNKPLVVKLLTFFCDPTGTKLEPFNSRIKAFR